MFLSEFISRRKINSSLVVGGAGDEPELCLRAGEFFFDPRTGVEDMVRLVLSNVRSLRTGGSQPATPESVSRSGVGKKEEEDAAQEIPVSGERRKDDNYPD